MQFERSWDLRWLRDVARDACAVWSVPWSEPQIMRLGSNAKVRIGDHVLRVASDTFGTRFGMDHMEREVQIVQHLQSQSFPTVKLEDVGQPITVDNASVTLWRYLHHQLMPDHVYRDVDGLLRAFHDVFRGSVPVWDPFARVDVRIARIRGMDIISDR